MSVIQTHQTSATLTVTISRPEALNALNTEVLDGLRKVMQEAVLNNTVNGIILTGSGEKAFVAGADIREFIGLSSEQALELSKDGQNLFAFIEGLPKPVIAAIDGFALGGGCELAMCCHLRIATESSKFGQPEVNLGLIPGYGGTQRLTQLVGRGKALELMMTGEMISAHEALSLGLVNYVVANKEALMEKANAILNKIYTKAPLAVANVIKSVNAGFGFETKGYEAEANNFAACTTTEDFKEGTAAFLEKRKAQFTGK